MTEPEDLVALLPHRPPMRLLDRAEKLPDGILLAWQTIPTEEDPVLRSHFPGFPIWPGALLFEAMAQTTAIYLLQRFRNRLGEDHLPVLGGVDGRLLHPVYPGETIRFRTRLLREIEGLGLFAVEATKTDGSVAGRARISSGFRSRRHLAQ